MAVVSFSDGKSLSLEGPFSGIDMLKAREDLRLYDYVALRVEGRVKKDVLVIEGCDQPKAFR